jgi:hypothetical protein
MKSVRGWRGPNFWSKPSPCGTLPAAGAKDAQASVAFFVPVSFRDARSFATHESSTRDRQRFRGCRIRSSRQTDEKR